MVFDEICFEGRIIYDNYGKEEEYNKFLESFNEFFRNKNNIFIGEINESKFNKIEPDKNNFNQLNGEFLIKGKVIADNSLTEEQLYEYIQEYITVSKYNIKISRIYKEKYGTEFFPVENPPQYLYQYTSIDTLKAILSKKDILFNNLVDVDDIEEADVKEIKNYGRFCFVSCWFPNDEESIPMWDRYGKQMKGIRIRLPINPFKSFDDNFDKGLGAEYLYKKYIISFPYEIKAYNVYYDDSVEKRFPQIIQKHGNEIFILNNKFGRYKVKDWDYQNEWRYKIFIWPFTTEEFIEYTKKPENFICELKRRKLPFSNLCIKLDEEKLKDIEITMGPNTTLKDKEDVIKLLNENFNNINAEEHVKNSQIKIQ